jgi:hypothetical protein
MRRTRRTNVADQANNRRTRRTIAADQANDRLRRSRGRSCRACVIRSVEPSTERMQLHDAPSGAIRMRSLACSAADRCRGTASRCGESKAPARPRARLRRRLRGRSSRASTRPRSRSKARSGCSNSRRRVPHGPGDSWRRGDGCHRISRISLSGLDDLHEGPRGPQEHLAVHAGTAQIPTSWNPGGAVPSS